MIQFFHKFALYLWSLTGWGFVGLVAVFATGFLGWLAYECRRAPIIEDEQYRHNAATGRNRAELERDL